MADLLPPRAPNGTTLLERLANNPDDLSAWEAVIVRYRHCVTAWCLRLVGHAEDAEDAAQDVWLRIRQRVRSFDRSRLGRSGARGWLFTFVRSCAYDWLTAQRPNGMLAPDVLASLVDSSESVLADLASRLDREYQMELKELAEAHVRSQVQESTWQCFYRMTYLDTPAKTIANDLGLQIGTVYQHRYRVEERIRQRVRELESPHESRPASES
jgi:RNA polymerase sigma-70 factor (ECF subfamily)